MFADAPFPSQAGPDVLSVYSECGPFRRWLRWKPEHPALTAEEIVRALDESLDAAMRHDDLQGATGQWVALMGFSQGAKLSASLLYRQQREQEILPMEKRLSKPNFRFAVLIAGRSPLISLDTGINLDQDAESGTQLPDASQITDFVTGDIDQMMRMMNYRGHSLRLPTIHVHGLKDPGLKMHRQLYTDYCEPESRVLVQWDGDHRLPIKHDDVAMLVHEIRKVAKQTGVY